MRRIVSSLAFLPLVGCTGAAVDLDVKAPGDGQAIINGDVCDEATEPTAVAIMIDATVNFGQGQPFDIVQASCTGTLIAPDVVLLAAHCLDLSLLTFGFGTVERSEFYVTFEADLSRFAEADPQGTPLPIPESAIPAKGSVVHPNFDIQSLGEGTAGVESDVAVLFLEVPIETVLPEVVITAAEGDQIADGAAVTIAGWGQQVATSGPFDPPPAGSVGIKVCGSTTVEEVGQSMIQVGDAPESTRKCHGDSGGPTYMEVETSSSIKRRVIGVTSRAYDQSDCAKGGVDTRVDFFVDWLDGEMKKACADDTRVWCDVDGVLSADDVVALGEGDGEGEGEGEGLGDPVTLDSCGSCASSGVGVVPTALLGLIALLRRRRAGRQ